MAKNLEIKKEVVFYAKLLDKKGLVNPLPVICRCFVIFWEREKNWG